MKRECPEIAPSFSAPIFRPGVFTVHQKLNGKQIWVAEVIEQLCPSMVQDPSATPGRKIGAEKLRAISGHSLFIRTEEVYNLSKTEKKLIWAVDGCLGCAKPSLHSDLLAPSTKLYTLQPPKIAIKIVHPSNNHTPCKVVKKP